MTKIYLYELETGLQSKVFVIDKSFNVNVIVSNLSNNTALTLHTITQHCINLG